MDQNLTEANSKLQSSIDHFKMELSGVRAGRANPSLIENVLVEAYGAKMKLVEVGTIAAPQPSLLTVQIWDASLTSAVIKAFQESNLGLNPSNEGQLIRLPIPPLTAERREELVKVVHQKLEDARVALRQIRQDTRQGWVIEKESGTISEDELFRREKLLQDLIDKKMLEIEEMSKGKEEELREI
jgi:ribosome recycling factor